MPIGSLEKPKLQNIATNKVVFSPSFSEFLHSISQSEKKSTKSSIDEPMIRVSSVVSGAARVYERLRYSVDYHEEHLLRRHALQRILRRRFDQGVVGTARSLIVELVHGHYLKNERVPESTVPKLQELLDRYAALLHVLDERPLKRKAELKSWFIGVAAADIDDFLVPAPEESALVSLMRFYAERDNPLVRWRISETDRKEQIFIAAWRALFAVEEMKLRQVLFAHQFPGWRTVPASGVAAMLPDILRAHARIDKTLQHPVGERLFKALRERSLVFHALLDTAREHKDQAMHVLQREDKLTLAVQQTCERYYRAARGRLFQSAIRSTIYIFITKVAIALLVEVPIEAYLYGTFITLPVIINLAFPPGTMLVLTMTTRLPQDANTKEALRLLRIVRSNTAGRIFRELSAPRRASAISRSALSVIYLLAFFVTFGLIISLLQKLHFTLIGIVLFLFFMSVVAFFALRIRQPVRDLYVIPRRENVIVGLINFFSLPLLRAGRWISLTSSRFNVFLYLLDYFLEAPIKSFLLVTEDVLGFFREKREDII